jgi:hypothetical protein
MGVTLTKPLLTFLLTSILGAGLAYGGGAPPNDTDAGKRRKFSVRTSVV